MHGARGWPCDPCSIRTKPVGHAIRSSAPISVLCSRTATGGTRKKRHRRFPGAHRASVRRAVEGNGLAGSPARILCPCPGVGRYGGTSAPEARSPALVHGFVGFFVPEALVRKIGTGQDRERRSWLPRPTTSSRTRTRTLEPFHDVGCALIAGAAPHLAGFRAADSVAVPAGIGAPLPSHAGSLSDSRTSDMRRQSTLSSRLTITAVALSVSPAYRTAEAIKENRALR